MDGDIEARLEQVAALLNSNLRAVAAAEDAFDAITSALGAGSITVVRLATALADLDGIRKGLDAQAAGLAPVPSMVGLTAEAVRVIRHRERQLVEAEARRGDGRPYLRAVGD